MTDIKRRKLITFMSAVPAAALVTALPSHAADSPMVDEASAEAMNWEYVAVSADEAKNCSNCALYQGADGSESGGCALFPGKHVAATGHCKAHAPRPS